tara:strand:+ start:953 stop:1402 length:450 start_codon:yes stop_codon:yes gene_type:complete
MQTAIVGIGCFWVESKFKDLKGVISTEVGYCGGNTSETNYEMVCQGKCDSAEVIKINFDEEMLDYKDLLRFVFSSHDPTTLNRQGPDVGRQYRSEIFFMNDNQKKEAEIVRGEFNKKFNGGVVTKISKVSNYKKAEEYHQKYYQKKGVL